MFLGVTLLVVIAVLLAIPTLGLSLIVPLFGCFAPKVIVAGMTVANKVILFGAVHSAKAMFVAASPFLAGRVLLDKTSDGGGGAGDEQLVLDPEDADTIVKGVKSIADGQKSLKEQLLSDVGRLDKETKKVLEEITTLKKTANDQDANTKGFLRKLDEFDKRLQMEARAAFGNPIKRIQQDEEMRWRLNAAVRLAVTDKNGDFSNMVEKQFPDFIKKSLKEWREKQFAPEQKALGEDSSPGSTLINQQLMHEIYNTLQTYGIWNTFAVRRLGTKTNILPVKTARAVAVAIINEGTQIPDDTNKAGTTVTATVVDVAALLNVYLRLIQDAEFDVTGDVLDDFGQAVAFRLDWFCTQASGTADTVDGGMTGIFGGGGTTFTAAAGNTTVEQTQEADWRNCILAVDAAVLQRMAKWWLHNQMLVRALAIKDKNGRCIWLSALEAPSSGAIGSILGYPTVLGAVCPTTNAAGAKIAAFGDPDGQVVGIRNDFEVAASDHFKWDYLQRSFRIVGRAATKIRKSSAFSVFTLPAA